MASMTAAPPRETDRPPASPEPARSIENVAPAGRPATTFEQLASLPDEDIDVAMGAAFIARDAYASLDVAKLLARFDDLAEPLAGFGLASRSAEEQVDAISDHLYAQLGFRGNEQDYYDPKNSLLPDVLGRRLGIPITLALVYTEVARRVGVRAQGVSFPGHYLVRVDQGSSAEPVLIDPFFGGRRLDEPSLEKLLERGAPAKKLPLAEHLAPASPRTTLVRMLINLKWIYATRGDFARALLALDRIISLTPDSVPAIRERGLLAARLGSVEAARADLSRVLELVPQAPDANSLRQRLDELRAKRGVLN
jgi:regulator of sirC expression with transglutaminase-like and TPR domain